MSLDPITGQTEAQLEENTRRTLAALRRFLWWPYPGWVVLAVTLGWWLASKALVALALLALLGWGLAHARAQGLLLNVWDRLSALALKTLRREPAPPAQRALMHVSELPRVTWTTPAINEDHARYRSEYDKLLDLMPTLSRDGEGDGRTDRRKTILYLAEIIDGLHAYGDNPLVAQTPKPVAAQGFLGPVSVVSAGLKLWPIAAAAVLTGGVVVQTVRLDRVKADLTEARHDLVKMTERAATAETQVSQDTAAFEALRVENHATRVLNETLSARQARLEERQRRSSNDQLEAARGGRPVDLDGRLRELGAQPFFAAPDRHSEPAGDSAGGVPAAAPGARDVSAADAAAAGADGNGAGDRGESR